MKINDNFTYSENEIKHTEQVVNLIILINSFIGKRPQFSSKIKALKSFFNSKKLKFFEEADPILYHLVDFISNYKPPYDVVINIKDSVIVSIIAKNKDQKLASVQITKEMRRKSLLFGDSAESLLLQKQLLIKWGERGII